MKNQTIDKILKSVPFKGVLTDRSKERLASSLKEYDVDKIIQENWSDDENIKLLLYNAAYIVRRVTKGDVTVPNVKMTKENYDIIFINTTEFITHMKNLLTKVRELTVHINNQVGLHYVLSVIPTQYRKRTRFEDAENKMYIFKINQMMDVFKSRRSGGTRKRNKYRSILWPSRKVKNIQSVS
jgi:hypothetical protein